MLFPMLVQYLVGLCALRNNPDAVDVTVGDLVLDTAARKRGQGFEAGAAPASGRDYCPSKSNVKASNLTPGNILLLASMSSR